MLGVQAWRTVLGVDRATEIESIEFDEDAGSVVVHVRPRRSEKLRCGGCRKRAPGYDQGVGRRELAGTRCRNAAVFPAGRFPSSGVSRARPDRRLGVLPATVPATPGSSTIRWPGW